MDHRDELKDEFENQRFIFNGAMSELEELSSGESIGFYTYDLTTYRGGKRVKIVGVLSNCLENMEKLAKEYDELTKGD